MIDEQIQSGAFAVVSLIVDDRLFVANVGTAHVFICVYDKKSKMKRIVCLETPHTLATFTELERLAKLNANVPLSYSQTKTGNKDEEEESVITTMSTNYTRCLGNFKLKYYYDEYPEFEFCTSISWKNHSNFNK